MMDIPNAILQMAYNKIYIPLSMLTSSTLSKIRSNNNLKYRMIPFSNGIGRQSLDNSSFPLEDLLTETTFFQSYRNWLTLIDLVSTPEVVLGWHEHHSRMLHDEHFSSSFDAWCDMDKQLCPQFISHLFNIDPTSPTYLHLLGCDHMDSFLSQSAKAQQLFESHHSFRTYPQYQSPHMDSGPSSSPQHAPYVKSHHHGEGKKPALCLCCGVFGHRANACSSSHPSHPERPFISEWKANKLISKNNKTLCVMFNVRGHCTDRPSQSHGEHTCSLGSKPHPASHCARN